MSTPKSVNCLEELGRVRIAYRTICDSRGLVLMHIGSGHDAFLNVDKQVAFVGAAETHMNLLEHLSLGHADLPEKPVRKYTAWKFREERR